MLLNWIVRCQGLHSHLPGAQWRCCDDFKVWEEKHLLRISGYHIIDIAHIIYKLHWLTVATFYVSWRCHDMICQSLLSFVYLLQSIRWFRTKLWLPYIEAMTPEPSDDLGFYNFSWEATSVQGVGMDKQGPSQLRPGRWEAIVDDGWLSYQTCDSFEQNSWHQFIIIHPIHQSIVHCLILSYPFISYLSWVFRARHLCTCTPRTIRSLKAAAKLWWSHWDIARLTDITTTDMTLELSFVTQALAFSCLFSPCSSISSILAWIFKQHVWHISSNVIAKSIESDDHWGFILSPLRQR